MKIALIIIGLILVLGISGASEYAFGTKVLSGDADVGRPLNDLYNPTSTSPGVGAAVMMWDLGPNPGFYDQNDVLYLVRNTVPLPATTTSNTIRLTPFESYPAGSKVASDDEDIGMPLSAIPGFPPFFTAGLFVILDLYDTSAFPTPFLQQYDLGDPVYWHRVGSTTGTNDVRLSDVSASYGLVPGTKLNNFDLDHFKPIRPEDVWQALPSPPTSWLKYYDANGNSIYDYPDDVYLVRPVPSGSASPAAMQVTVNSLRLSGPAT
jgi:hypothetical protein